MDEESVPPTLYIQSEQNGCDADNSQHSKSCREDETSQPSGGLRRCGLVTYRHTPRFCISFQALQVGTDVRSVLVAQVAVFLQALVDDPFQFHWHIGIQPNRGNGRAVEDGLKNHSSAFAPEGQSPRGHLVQNCTEGEQISSCIQFLDMDLFR